MAVDLFAGIPVSDYAAAVQWYSALFGSPPSFLPNDTEAVWAISEHGWAFIEVRPAHAGHASHTVYVEDLEARLAALRGRGLEPETVEAYDNGVRKAIFRDPDGNQLGIGGGSG